MSIFTLIPVKKLSESKTRLSTILKPEERKDFTLNMLKDVLKAIFISSVKRIVLIGSDISVQKISSNYEATFLPDTEDELNNVLEYATNWCIYKGAEAVLILPADIPLITSSDIEDIVSLCLEEHSVAISPSYNGGTNALMRRPPNFILTYFGNGSFKKHVDEALKKGVTAKIYRSPRLALDIDSPEDLKRFFKIGDGTKTHQFLKAKRIDERLEKLSPSHLCNI